MITDVSTGVHLLFSTDFITDIALSMILYFHFSYSQPGYKGKYYYSPTPFSVAIG